jgi:Putative zinc-finger
MTDCTLAHSDAAYVLGSLSPTDRLAFERHLSGCEPCRRSIAELAGLPGLLGRVSVDQVEVPIPVEPVPDTVLPALVTRVRREQRRRSLVMVLGAAAAVAAVAVGVNGLQSTGDDGAVPPPTTTTSVSPSTAVARPMQVVLDYGVTADVSLTEVKWGTKVGITCRYDLHQDYGSGHAYKYNLVAVTRSGAEKVITSWRAKPGETYVDDPVTAVKLRQIQRLEVQSEHGQTILRLDV